MKRPLIIAIAAVVIVLTAIGVVWKKSPQKKDSSNEAQATGPRDRVELSDQKLAAAQIGVVAAERRSLQACRSVPGRIEYNLSRHVLLKAPFDGLIRSVDVKVGDQVAEGQVMGVVDSPELGEKRADVLLRETDFGLAKKEFEWWKSIQSNLDELIARLKRPQDILQLEKDFVDKPLGDYRGSIFEAYAQMRLDEKLRANLDVGGGDNGAFPGKTKLERDAAREKSTAKFCGMCDQAAFDVKQKELKAESVMKDAERRLTVARQRLGLLVSHSQEAFSDPKDESSLSMWTVKAPFAGTIEEILVPSKERVQTGEGLFQLADTTQLWVQADIRERDWPALSISAGQTVKVQTPALPGRTLDATVSFIGRAVATDTRAVPLTAIISNSEGLLRPGMFVRVLIPEGEPRQCLTVPQSAIATNEGSTFVFIRTGAAEFRPRDVKTGLSVDPWVEITSGIESGEPVVATGAATLKAELLLEPEE